MAVALQESVEKTVIETISAQVESIKEEIVKAAVEKFEKEIKKAVGQVAIALSNYFSVERMGSDLLIRVKFDNSK